jgi:hypothetical protein
MLWSSPKKKSILVIELHMFGLTLQQYEYCTVYCRAYSYEKELPYQTKLQSHTIPHRSSSTGMKSRGTANMHYSLDDGNSKWCDATKLPVEFDQLHEHEYTTFQDVGHSKVATPPARHRRISVHLVFDVKHDGRHKVRCVADGHLTDVPLHSV